MGINRKSHGKKTDKETQSPVLKIFKDIMQKENTDPEKVNLLKAKHKDKKKKSYSESRSKSDPKSYDSSSTDRYKNRPKITVQNIQEDKEIYNKSGSQYFQNEKRESWWVWGDKMKKPINKSEDNRSISCALKRLISSEYTCVACLFILFAISVIVIFFMVFQMPDTEKAYESETFNRIEKRQLTENYGYHGYTEKNKWDSTFKNKLSGFPAEYVGELKDSNILDGLESGISEDLAGVLDSEKVIENRENSEKLKDFFKKLLQTDAQIRRLKQVINNNFEINNNDKTFAERYKRSLKNRGKNVRHIAFKNKNYPLKVYSNLGVKNKRAAQSNNNNVTGFVIRKENFLIQYEDKKRNFPKCSHEHKTNSHDHKVTHPSYKNSQRLHELLGTRKSSDNENEILLTEKKSTNQRKTTKSTTIDFHNYDSDVIFNKQDTKTEISNNNFASEIGYAMSNLLSTSPSHDFTLSVSTFINPIVDKNSNNTLKPGHYHLGHRKLLQVEEEKEELSYGDLNEVLTDNQQADYDDVDRHVEKKKRNNEQEVSILNAQNSYENNPSNIYNPNWKGPMPLYPDELNAMIKQAALQNLNIQVPVNTKDTRSEKDKDEKDVSDTEYVEDYIDSKYHKMVKMAQAYSDYGVVYGKNDNNNDGNSKNTEQDQKYKLFFDKGKLLNRFFRKPGKPEAYFQSEGFKFEIKPGTAPSDSGELIKGIDKHVKICKSQQCNQHCNNEYEKMYTPSTLIVPTDSNVETTVKHLIFTIKKGSRSLKSVNIDEKFVDTDNKTSNDNKFSNLTNGIIDFIYVMSDWFRTLAGLSDEKDGDILFKSLVENGSYIRANGTYKEAKNKTLENSDIFYPSYDFNMVDNIGRRSRVLMSVEDNNTLGFNKNNITKNESNISTSSDFENVVPITLILATQDKANFSKGNNNSDSKKYESNTEIKNKTIVKRNLDNKVFWNDMYDDDEYGVNVDYIDGIRSKHSVDKNYMQKSKNWIKNKIKNITHKIKYKIRKKPKCTTKKKTKSTKPRSIRQVDYNENNEIKRSFAALTANMKKVFQKAAKEIENTRNIDVRAENKEEAAVTSLMQQLVRLMSDLVDIQVQQKTCAMEIEKQTFTADGTGVIIIVGVVVLVVILILAIIIEIELPADLHSFLEWLTVPTDNIRVEVDSLANMNPGVSDNLEDGLGRFGKSTDSTLDLPTFTEDTHQDDRTDCLGIIRSVQDLIQRYEEMTDEDKSKMTGVKEYLENQLQFLNKKLDNVDDSKLYKIYGKRQIPRERRYIWNSKNHRGDSKSKFIKSFVKKHTRSTMNTYDGITITKNKKLLKESKEKQTKDINNIK